MKSILVLVFLIKSIGCCAQAEVISKLFRITSAFTSFPDTARAAGHVYDKVLYTASEHYSDSSALIVVPPQLRAGKHVDVIFWFHG